VKRLWLVVALAAAAGLASNTFADVQNIRISGDIRIRGYYLARVAGNDDEDQAGTKDSFISQRTRVTVEADLEDHVLVVVTLKAESLWGSDSETVHNESGAGSGGLNGNVNRGWDTGVSEAYVQFSELFYAPLTLKVGRQYLHYGHGLIISSVEQEYNYDAARLVLDYYPLTIDLVYAKMAANTVFGPGTHSSDTDVLFLNARYEFTDSLIKNVEAYFGYTANSNLAGGSSRVPPTSGAGDSPMIIGVRSDMNLTENLSTWVEGAYEFGSATTGDNISAWLANAGAKFTLKDVQWAPVFNANFTYASGGGSDGEHAFRPWFDYVDGYNGYLLMPRLSNIMIFNVGGSVKPSENTSVSLQGYYYYGVDTVAGNPGVGLISNPNVDFGGLGYSPGGSSHNIGWELDSILGYDYSKDVRFQLVYAFFIPEHAYTVFASDAVAHLVRAEINARF
jgi:Alginate export